MTVTALMLNRQTTTATLLGLPPPPLVSYPHLHDAPPSQKDASTPLWNEFYNATILTPPSDDDLATNMTNISSGDGSQAASLGLWQDVHLKELNISADYYMFHSQAGARNTVDTTTIPTMKVPSVLLPRPLRLPQSPLRRLSLLP